MTENYKEKNFTLSYVPMMIEHFSIKNVFIYHRENNEFPVKILEIHENEILVEKILCSDKKIICINKENIETFLSPILLTIDNIKQYLNIDFELNDELLSQIEDRKDYYDKKTHQIRLTETNTYVSRRDMTNNPCIACHVDNNSYDTIGTADLMYIHEFQNFLASIGENIDWFKNE